MATEFAVFVKPWKTMPLERLAVHVQKLGFNLVELPVRPGFYCEPDHIEQDLPEAIKMLGDLGVRVLNISAALPLDDERLYATCAANGIRMNRVIFKRQGVSYWESEDAARRQLDAALPLCERYNVQIGVQNHAKGSVPVNSMGLYNLLKDYDPRYVGAIWDPAHNALQGEDPHAGLEMVRTHLCMVNLKNAFWRRTSQPGEAEVTWAPYFSAGPQGRSDWREVAAAVKRVGYTGPLTFSAEYTDETYTDRLLAEDLAYARRLFDA